MMDDVWSHQQWPPATHSCIYWENIMLMFTYLAMQPYINFNHIVWGDLKNKNIFIKCEELYPPIQKINRPYVYLAIFFTMLNWTSPSAANYLDILKGYAAVCIGNLLSSNKGNRKEIRLQEVLSISKFSYINIKSAFIKQLDFQYT